MPATCEAANSDPTTATSDTSMVVTKPTGLAVGDLMLAFGGCVTTRTISPPGTWTEQANDTDGTKRVYVWTKVADAADVAASNFTFTASATFSSAIVSIHRISGASSNAPTTGFGTGANSTTQTCPTIVTPSANCLVIWGAYHTTNGTSTADKGTERVDAGNGTSGCWMSQYSNLEASAGSVTGAVITSSASGAKRVFSVAIESAAGATVGGPVLQGRVISPGRIFGGSALC